MPKHLTFIGMEKRQNLRSIKLLMYLYPNTRASKYTI